MKLAPNKAPGPDFIPPKIVRETVLLYPEIILKVFNNLLRALVFPDIWKVARVALIEKPIKNRGEERSFRPICLLNTIGKLFESVLNNRLRSEISQKNAVSDNQYGFCKGKCTIDAIRRVTEVAEEEIGKRGNSRNRKICLLITIDIRNAFNSASWRLISHALEEKGISRYLIGIIESYLSDRKISDRSMTAGVPQGSVIGPTLWNVLYDGVLRIIALDGVKLVAYADDLAIIVTARDESELEFKANYTLGEIKRWMENHKLEVAPEKSECMLIVGRKQYRDMHFLWGGQEIVQKDNIKYLGVVLDRRLSFQPHLEYITNKAEKTVTALARITPNVGGPGENKRRVLATAANSIILYAAPVWVGCLKVKKNREKLLRRQRIFTLRVSSAYRTVSTEAATVIARVIPIDLQIEERAASYGKSKEERGAIREQTLTKWQERWEQGQKGAWTRELIRDVIPWYNRRFGEVDFWLTQVLSGHGCFEAFVHKIGKKASPTCRFCDMIDNAEHTLFVCPRWGQQRERTNNLVGRRLTKENLIECMLFSERNWKEVKKLTGEIMREKAEIERMERERAHRNGAGG